MSKQMNFLAKAFLFLMMAGVGMPTSPGGSLPGEVIEESLNVDFEEGYEAGPVAGQIGGVVGGEWIAPEGQFVVEGEEALGRQALRASGSGLHEPLNVRLATELAPAKDLIYFAVDVYLPDEGSKALWTLTFTTKGSTVGLGFAVGDDSHLEYLVGERYRRLPSAFVVEPGKWHRFEIEARGWEGKYNLYVQVEGEPRRQLILENVDWEAVYGIADGFQLIPLDKRPGGIVTDNVVVWKVEGFPINRPLDGTRSESPSQ